MKNPFPGLNPYLQRRWQSAHASLIVYLRDQILPALPNGLSATIEEGISVDLDDPSPDYRPDVHIHEDWGNLKGVTEPQGGVGIALAPPALVVKRKDPIKQRFIEIVDSASNDRVITVIEILSPTNKQGGSGIANYQDKQRTVLAGGASLVEIDFLRGFKWTPVLGVNLVLANRRDDYRVAVTRATSMDDTALYRCPLREPLPNIPIPLRPSDADIVVSLQALMDKTVENSGLTARHYQEAPQPPLSPEDAAWAEALLSNTTAGVDAA